MAMQVTPGAIALLAGDGKSNARRIGYGDDSGIRVRSSCCNRGRLGRDRWARVCGGRGEPRTAMFAGTYVGAGVGLLTAVSLGSLLTLLAQLLNTASSTWFDALDVAGNALLWGVAGGAAGGLVISLVVVTFNIRAR